MFTVNFWKATFERSLGTAAAVFLSAYSVDTAGWLSVDHLHTLEISGIAFGLTVLKCIVVATLSDGTPSFGNVETFNTASAKSEPVVPAVALAPAPVPQAPAAPAPTVVPSAVSVSDAHGSGLPAGE